MAQALTGFETQACSRRAPATAPPRRGSTHTVRYVSGRRATVGAAAEDAGSAPALCASAVTARAPPSSAAPAQQRQRAPSASIGSVVVFAVAPGRRRQGLCGLARPGWRAAFDFGASRTRSRGRRRCRCLLSTARRPRSPLEHGHRRCTRCTAGLLGLDAHSRAPRQPQSQPTDHLPRRHLRPDMPAVCDGARRRLAQQPSASATTASSSQRWPCGEHRRVVSRAAPRPRRRSSLGGPIRMLL